MNPDERPVHIRTSASARDFWCRLRDDSEDSEDVSPDGKVISKRSFLDNSNTPFGRQNRPGSMTSSSFANKNTFFATMSPTASVTPPIIDVMSSREVERLVFKKEISKLEPDLVVKADWEKENAMLRRALITNKQQLKLTLQVNRALAQANAKLTVAMAAGTSK